LGTLHLSTGFERFLQTAPKGEGAITSVQKLIIESGLRYYISAAPQCQFPDAYLGHALNTVAFDMIYGTWRVGVGQIIC
jgi:hypothetical protein